jgi:hypothetical protein
MPEADETIITKFIVEAEDAIQESEKFRKQVDDVKKQLKDLSVTTKESLDVIAEGLKRAKFDELGRGAKLSVEAKNKIQEFGKATSVALKEVRQDTQQAVQVLKMLQGINLGATRVQFQQTRDATVSFLNAMRGAHQATQPFTERLRGLVTNLSNFSQVGSFVFGSVLGVTAVTALQRVTRAFIEFAQEILRRGTEMTEVIFTLEVAIRGLQRVGLDTTIESWTGRIQELKKEFPFFPRREFIEGASLAALMTREFGFTEAQIANIVRQSSILAQITGKDLLESVRGITFAIGSGYFESLQRAGVNISRQVVATEALAQGYEGVYNELEPTIRASVTYSVIQNNLNAIQEDASRRTEIFAGQVQILTSRLEDLKNLFGEVVTASDSLTESLIILNDLLESITDIYETLSRLDIDIFAPFKELTGLETIIRNIETLAVTLEGLNNVMSTLIDNAKTFGAILGAIGSVAGAFGLDFVSQAFKQLQEDIVNISRSLGDLERTEEIEIKIRIGETEFSEEDYQKIVEITQEANDEILEIEEEGLEKRQDIIEDYQRDVEDGWEKHLQKLEDLQRDFSRRLTDIDLKERQRISDEVADNAFRIQEAIRKSALRREEAERKFREREISAERKFQEKLRQLRENFLLDLEDAVRERDARQIIRLTRQFNLRRQQMIREEKLNKDDRQSQFEEELRQIEFQRQERLRQLAIEHQRRLESIALQAERERQQAQIDFERRQQAEQERFNREKEDRNQRLAEQFKDLEDSIQDRINRVIQGLADEHDLSEDWLDAIAKLYESTYGPNSRIDNALVWFMQRLQQARAMMQTFRLERLQGMTFVPPGFSGEGAGYAGPSSRRWNYHCKETYCSIIW